MAATLFLIRHGETEGAEIRRYKGSLDVPLSENGQRQMERVAAFVKESLAAGPGKGLEAVYSSDLSRARRSAEIVGRPYGLEPAIIPGLRERNFGIWEGMSFDEIRAKYPAEFSAWASDPLRYSPMGGESTLGVRERVVSSLCEITGRHPDSPVAIVSHGGVNRIILCHFLGMPLENIFRVEQDYGAVNVIELWEDYPVIKLMNGVVYG